MIWDVLIFGAAVAAGVALVRLVDRALPPVTDPRKDWAEYEDMRARRQGGGK